MDTAHTIANRINAFFQHLDDRNWKMAEAVLTDPVHLDDPYWCKGGAQDLAPTEAVDHLKAFLGQFAGSLHYISNIIVESQEQKACARLYSARTYFGPRADADKFFKLYGIFDISLVYTGGQWSIDFLRFQKRFDEGDRTLAS
ncbi:nuclear transport factor 2 family protein [Pseudovibrio exalbescens]|uniref:nuclear transport factor 2 family protein n=1 Tax=Pseudovibrio exalbescens TaxID=197461 RepID=UPI0023669E4E|nr:nuclear transport factor 2 family protein [Pseudovibrio exalbescens]MDD7909250.1 nuclear transport factor 2 family protein [Pseudovibrio exalbescens]